MQERARREKGEVDMLKGRDEKGEKRMREGKGQKDNVALLV